MEAAQHDAGGNVSPGHETPAIASVLGEQLGRFARTLQAETDPDAVLAEVVRSAVALIPGTDEGSVSMVSGRREVTSLHPTSTLPERVDALQTETGQGPCLDALYKGTGAGLQDMTDSRLVTESLMKLEGCGRRGADVG